MQKSAVNHRYFNNDLNQIKGYTDLRDFSKEAKEKHTTYGKLSAAKLCEENPTVKERIEQLKKGDIRYLSYKEKRILEENQAKVNENIKDVSHE